MTPETKAWFEEFKNRCLGYTPADMFTHCWSDNKQCIQIIESQAKEIESLKVIAEYVTANVYFKDSTWGDICVSCLSERGKGHDEDCELYTVIKHLLEDLWPQRLKHGLMI